MKPKRILIVDPDSSHCDALEEGLSNEGYLVYTAANRIEAEKLAIALMPHITVMDEQIPDGRIPDLTASIINASPQCHFIVQTDKDPRTVMNGMQKKEVVRVVRKPLTVDRLLSLLSHISELVDLKKEKLSTEESLLKRNRELEDINERLKQIVESTRRLTSFSGTGDLGPVMLHEFASSMNAKGGSLFLHKDNELVLVYSLDKNHVPIRIPLPLGPRTVMGHVLTRNEPLLIEDITKEAPFLSSGYKGYSDNSLLAFPMLEKNGAIVGIITLHNKVNPPFTRQDKELGAILASYGSETLRATQAIEDLRQSEEKARTIVEANPDPVVMFDKEKKVRYLNPAFSRIFGWTLAEQLGKRLENFIPDQSIPQALSMDEMEKRGESYTGIETLRHAKDGRLIPVSISGASFSNKSGKMVGSVCNIRDITDQKTMEEQLVQSQKMEAIGTLASGIAHDFNNILSAIFGNLELAFMDMPKDIAARRNIENVMKAAHRAKDLVSQILSFSRKSERLQGITRKINPHLIIREALILLRASLPSTIEIKENVTEKNGAIHADPTQFHQIIMNLCTNAHHAMKENGGTLTIGLDKIVETAESPGAESLPQLRLTISDTGCGMDEAVLKRIFDPYFTTKTKDLGTGLGLSVVRKIVEDCKGQIAVFSRPGHGTRFELTFPEAGRLEKEAAAAVTELGKGSGNILFVDDEIDIANLGVTLLQRLGYTVASSTQPLEALNMVKSAPASFDMVITDMTMPKMTGTRLAEAIKDIRPDLPIILCTGFSRAEIPENAKAHGIDAILKKPVDLRDFAEAIGRVLAGKTAKTSPPPPDPGLRPFFL